MSFPSLVPGQSADGFSPGGTGAISATLPAAATAGNLIVFAIGGDKNIGTLALPGFTPTVDLRSTSTSLVIAWKVATGGETTISGTVGANGAGLNTWVGEYAQTGSGAWQVQASATHNTDETNVAAWSSGTAGAAAQDGLAIAAFSVDSVTSDSVDTFSNSYTTRRTQGGGGSEAGLWVGEKQVPQGATTETTLTRSAPVTADQMSGAVVVFGRAVVVAPVGTPLIPELPGAAVLVEAAWGADLTDLTGASWTWSDITEDVRQEQGISGSLGRNDEMSNANPAKLSLKLDNATGRYSLGGQSPLWPNVRRNTPVRVLVNPADGGGSRTVFQGYAVGFTPGWDDDTGKVPVVELEAAGVLRRLVQGKDPLRSALYRFHTMSQTVTARPAEYWPLEEDKAATLGVSASGGGPAVFSPQEYSGAYYGKVKWGGDTDNPATERAPEMSAGGQLTLPVRSSLFSNYWAMTWSMRYSLTSGAFLRIRTDDERDNFFHYLIFYTSGAVEWFGVHKTGQFTAAYAVAPPPYTLDDIWHDYRISVDQSGGTVFWYLYRDGAIIASYSATPGFRGLPRSVEIISSPNPGGTEDPVAAGHVALWTSNVSQPAVTSAHQAHRGELAGARLSRLCTEQDIPITITGTTVNAMGPQRPLGLVPLLRECQDADLGVLYDGVGPGLAYLARDQRENATVDVTLDASQLVAPFEPVDDDQRTVNRSTATARSGAKYTAEDADGPLGTAAVGVYDSSVEVNLDADGDVPPFADWQVHQGTQEGYRYPSVSVDLRAQPVLAPAVLSLEPSTRLRVENVGSVISAMPEGDVDLLVEGLTWDLSPFGWKVKAKCSPYSVWRVGTIASPTGDTSDGLERPDTDGSTVASSAAAGATTLSVSTPSGPRWTTAADDFPLYLSVGGLKVRATACSGTGTTQSFTVDPLPVARASGSSVAVWNPPVLGL
ncbi:hypothetical protein [Pseudonocardia sp. NPDC049154]|uniref:hypothetical protein n=1 Tax=Pseudonocardia sp. NPDC049154 TaxID=3155501 RepID=UPI0033D6322C